MDQIYPAVATIAGFKIGTNFLSYDPGLGNEMQPAPILNGGQFNGKTGMRAAFSGSNPDPPATHQQREGGMTKVCGQSEYRDYAQDEYLGQCGPKAFPFLAFRNSTKKGFGSNPKASPIFETENAVYSVVS